MKLLMFTARERAIVVLFVLVCCLYGAYKMVYRPFISQEQQLRDEMRQTRRKLSEQRKIIIKDQQMPQGLRQGIEAIIQSGSNEEVMSGLLAELESAARSMNIRVTEIKPQGTVKEGEYNTFTVSLTIDGRFHDLMAYVHLLQAPDLDLHVAQLNLEKMTSAPGVLLARIVVKRNLIRPLQETPVR